MTLIRRPLPNPYELGGNALTSYYLRPRGGRKRPKKAAPTRPRIPSATPQPVSIPGLLTQDEALSQVMDLLQPIFDAQNARINAAYDARANAVKQAYDALAKYGQGVGPAISNIYQGAAKDTAAFGKGFSDAVSQLSSGQASDATAAIAAQGGPQTVTSGLANGGADALYAMGGSIPGSALEREGAAFGSAASFLPTEAAGLGAGAIKDLESQRLSDILGLEENRPQTIMDAVNDLLDQSYSRQQDALKLASSAQGGSEAKPQLRNLANGQIGTYVNGKLVSVSGPPRPETASSVKLQARTLANGQVQWFDPTTGRAVGKPVGPPRVRGKGSSPSNKLQARTLANGQIQWFNPKTGKAVGKPVGPPRTSGSRSSVPRYYGGLTKSQVLAKKADAYDTAQAAAQGFTDKDGVTHAGWKDMDDTSIRPRQVLQDLIGHGVPFGVAVREIAKFWPPAKKWYSPKSEAKAASATTPANASIVQTAMNAGPRSGATYVFGGAGPDHYDCSGYTMAMVSQNSGVQLPHQARAQFYDPRGIPVGKNDLRPGDVVFFRSSPNGQGDGPPYHCGYYIGNGKYVEYYSSGKPARVSNLNSRSDFMGGRRFGTARA